MKPRASGVILPVFALPSPHGIGTLGRQAYEFVRFLKKTGQSVWQMLPLGHTGYGDSPYQPMSSYAGNPYFVDLDMLVQDGLLKKNELDGQNENRVDYGRLFSERYKILEKAYSRGIAKERAALAKFLSENPEIARYARFAALKDKNFGKPWREWEYTVPDPEREEFYGFVQLMFFRQFYALKKYANENGVLLMGDLPIYVGYDSADVYFDPKVFQLEEDLTPRAVAGVPPDFFSATGQLWGNPLYDWNYLESTDFAWWRKRFSAAAKMFDIVRIDHFRGIESYWSVPHGALTAAEGHWEEGPGMKLINALREVAGDTEIVAEDLGVITPQVKKLLETSGFAGMRVLEFADFSNSSDAYLPKNYVQNCVCYTGTHDNAPLADWEKDLSEEQKANVKTALCEKEKSLRKAVISAGAKSKARLFVAQMQDYTGEENSRVNTPGTDFGNWRWRLPANYRKTKTARFMRRIAKMSKRG